MAAELALLWPAVLGHDQVLTTLLLTTLLLTTLLLTALLLTALLLTARWPRAALVSGRSWPSMLTVQGKVPLAHAAPLALPLSYRPVNVVQCPTLLV